MPANTAEDIATSDGTVPLGDGKAANDNPTDVALEAERLRIQAAANDDDALAGLPDGYRLHPQRGLERVVIGKEGEEWQWVCSHLVPLALERDPSGQGWAVRLEVTDPDGNRHQTTVPRSLAVNDGAGVREQLADLGLVMLGTAAARTALTSFLVLANPKRRITHVNSVGWHDDVFVLPDEAFGAMKDMEISFQGGRSTQDFRVAGTLVEWQQNVARYAVGNSRIVLALCVSFAAPLLRLAGAESGGVHFFGPSSTGKTTALYAAGSVWSGGGIRGNLQSWRTTDNALESTARGHSDTALMLDELGQADSRAVAAIAYLLSNNQGKARSTRDGHLRAPIQWRLVFNSTGEVTLTDKLTEMGGRAMAGQSVRLVDVPLPDSGLGIFDILPEGFATGAALANHFQEAAKKYYGTPSRAFLAGVTKNLDVVTQSVRSFISWFVAEYSPPEADGQVQRVAERFALFAAAGELAAEMGILPWEGGQATDGVVACFNAWLGIRGGNGPSEMLMAVQQVKDHFERFASKHYDYWRRGAPGIGSAVEARALDRFGYRTTLNGEPEFFLSASGLARLAAPYDQRALVKELIRLGMLKPGADGKSSVVMNIPGEPKGRYYHFVPGVQVSDEPLNSSGT